MLTPSEKYAKVSWEVGMMKFPTEWEKHKMFQTTNQILVGWLDVKTHFLLVVRSKATNQPHFWDVTSSHQS